MKKHMMRLVRADGDYSEFRCQECGVGFRGTDPGELDKEACPGVPMMTEAAVALHLEQVASENCACGGTGLIASHKSIDTMKFNTRAYCGCTSGKALREDRRIAGLILRFHQSQVYPSETIVAVDGVNYVNVRPEVPS